MKILQSLFFFFFMIAIGSFAQPSIEWQLSFGGTGNETARSIQQTTDAGFIVAGWSRSNDGHVSGNHGLEDYWVVKLDSAGSLQWQKSFGGTGNDQANAIVQTADGGYIACGFSYSNDGDVTGNHGVEDVWVVRMDSAGNLLWQKALGGTGGDRAYSIRQTLDGGYILGGYSYSINGDVTGNHGGTDFWLVKLDSAGNIQWQKSLGGSSSDQAYSAQQTADGGYVACGYSTSNDGDVTGNHGFEDYWIVKLDSVGTLQWQRALGGTGFDRAYSVRQTPGGGYIACGRAGSNDGDVTGNHGADDFWVVKLDSAGNMQWQHALGGSGNELGESVVQTADGGFVFSGFSDSMNGNVSGNHGGPDFWFVKLDSAGTLQWQKSLGGSGDDHAYSMQLTSGGALIACGRSNSVDGDVTGNHGGFDFWVTKLSSAITGVEQVELISDIQISPNPVSYSTSILFSITQPEHVSVVVYDLTGRVVRRLYHGQMAPGRHMLAWNTRDDAVRDGIYFVTLRTTGFSWSKRIVVKE